MRTFIYKDDDFYEETQNEAGYIEHLFKNDLFNIQSTPMNAWLTWSLQDLIAQCEKLDITLDQGMRVYLRNESIKDVVVYQTGFGFNKSGAIAL